MSRANPRTSKTIGSRDDKSRQKAKASHDRATEDQQGLDEGFVPRNAQGVPLAKVEIAAAELIPNGKFANVSVGPARITMWVDPDEEDPVPEGQRANLAKALNDLAEVVEVDVIGVQRNLVMESIQEQVAANGDSSDKS